MGETTTRRKKRPEPKLYPWPEATAAVKHRGPCTPPPGRSCPTMTAALRGAKDADAGLDVSVLISRGRNGKPDLAPFIFYRRAPADGGVLLNFCPWCGGTLRAGAERWEPAAKRKQRA